MIYVWLRRCPLSDSDFEASLVLASAGDLILWDSRTIHGGRVGTRPKQDADSLPEHVDLARLSVTVSMTAKDRASKKVLDARIAGYKRGICFNHTPHEAGSSSGTIPTLVSKTYKPVELSKEQLELLGVDAQLAELKDE